MGCASWSSAARPPPRKMTASRLHAQTRDPGPKIPARGSRTRVRSLASAPWRWTRDTVSTPGVAHAAGAGATPRGRCHRLAQCATVGAVVAGDVRIRLAHPDELSEVQRVE